MRSALSFRTMDCGKEVLHFGDTLKPIPRRQRVAVVIDDELANALERMRRYFPGKPAAALVHDLTIKGAVAIEDEEPQRRRTPAPAERATP